jgi:ankyrin repeat protein
VFNLFVILQLGWTPLMIAVSAGRGDIVQTLLDRGASVNHSNDNGQISLHYAASKGRLEMMQLLLRNGSKINTKDKYVSHYCKIKLPTHFTNRKEEMIFCFYQGMTPFHRSVSKGDLDVVTLLLNTGKVEIDAQDKEGNSALHMAAEDEHIEMYKLLLDKGADFKLQNKVHQLKIISDLLLKFLTNANYK